MRETEREREIERERVHLTHEFGRRRLHLLATLMSWDVASADASPERLVAVLKVSRRVNLLCMNMENRY